MTITNGKDFNFYKKITVSATNFTAAADVQFLFRGQQHFTFVNQGSNAVEYSFNGTTVHGELGATGTITATREFQWRPVKQIWFKCATGSNIVRVEAW